MVGFFVSKVQFIYIFNNLFVYSTKIFIYLTKLFIHLTRITHSTKSLYTNIPNEEDVAAIDNTLKRSNTDMSLKTVILTFLDMILTLNNFVFNGEHCLQIKGCVMGTKCARLMQTCLWTTLKQTTFTLQLNRKPNYTLFHR